MAAEHVVILGAGFSRAVSTGMPLTDELGNAALELVQPEGSRPKGLRFGSQLTFESWLSLLADDQPQLSEAENRDNAALFAHLRDAIAILLLEAQFSAVAPAAPAWLYEFISAVHEAHATVITLNYDTLIETAVASHSLWEPASRSRVAPRDILRDLPPLPNTGMRLSGPIAETFRLLKLHGSLDWWAVPGDLSGATLNREESHSVFEAPSELTVEARQQQLPGRERFIIPPLSTKSTYYRNPLTRELWRQAQEALRTANRISIVGYSLPVADAVMANMLRVALTGRLVSVDVVNPSPEDIVQRLIGLGVESRQIAQVPTVNCVEAFAHSLCVQASARLAENLRDRLLAEVPDASLAVAWGDSTAAGPTVRRVLDVSARDETTLELIIEDSPPPQGATSARRDPDGGPSKERFPTAADVAAKIGSRARIVARDAFGTFVLLAVRAEGRNTGANSRWLFFVPSDRGPAEATAPS